MAKKKNKRKKKTYKKRNIIVLGMVLANKPTRMKDKNDYNRKQEKNVDEVDVFDFKGQHSYVDNSLPWSNF
jgi:hypothetical protein